MKIHLRGDNVYHLPLVFSKMLAACRKDKRSHQKQDGESDRLVANKPEE
jgi:hypothetical protein